MLLECFILDWTGQSPQEPPASENSEPLNAAVVRAGGSRYVPSHHDVAGEQLRHAGTPVPEHPELGTVALEESQGGAHEVAQLHPPGAVLNGRRLLAGEEQPLEHWGGIVEVSRGKTCGRKFKKKKKKESRAAFKTN